MYHLSLQEKFATNWNQQFGNVLPKNLHMIVAVSGGIDSVVLLHLLVTSGFSISVAHCNFQLRGDESDRDEAFVCNLASTYNLPFHLKRFDTESYASERRIGIQEAARHLRYEWFTTLLQLSEVPHAYLCTAHHADDNVETVLFNIFRGTGISGIHGILPIQGKTIRPLLFAKREEIIVYAKTQQLQWVEDSSNESTKYTRNYIRHEVLPLLKQVFPGVADNINGNIERWREAEELYTEALDHHLSRLCVKKGNEMHLPVLKLLKTKPLKTILFEAVRPFGFNAAQLPDVIALLQSTTGKYVASATHRIIRNRDWLVIAPLHNESADHILIESGEPQVSFAEGKLFIEFTTNTTPAASNETATLDARDIHFPLLLRRWKQGDYFYPLGMQKKKKLSRFLIDNKLSLADKEKIWVLESGRRILWVVGQRIDNRFRITANTENVLRITLQTSN